MSGAGKRKDPERTKRICDAYTRGMPVREIAAMMDVQSPAIWRQLRAGGLIAPYRPQGESGRGRPMGGGKPGYTASRRDKSIARSSEPDMPRVDRDPCPRCGTRADYGCVHSATRLGVEFAL